MTHFRAWMLVGIVSLAGCNESQTLQGVEAKSAPVESVVSSITAGTVEAQQQTELAFGTSGRVQKVYAIVGQKVREGDILASLENNDLNTILLHAEREYARTQKLFQANLASKVGLDESRRNFEIAKSNLEKAQIRAPFDGLVTEVNLEIGELAQGKTPSGKPLIRLIDLKPRLVKGEIDEVDLAKVKEGDNARIKIMAARTQPFAASVSQVVPYVNTTKEQDRTSKVELKIADESIVIPVGASADIEIVTEAKLAQVAVPSRAILGHGSQRYIYKYNGQRIVKTPVRVGVGNYERTEVVEGLSLGEIVVLPSDTIEIRDQLKARVEISDWK